MFHNPAATVWRDFVTDGVPASGKYKVSKPDVRAWGAYVESLVAVAAGASKVYASKADLEADLVPAANTPAIVLGDSTPGNDGLYMKVGATTTGSWTQLTDFVPGTQIVHAVDAGAGTPNAIVATTDLGLSTTGAQIVRLDVYEANTGSPVTVAFNGGDALTIKTASGSDVAPGGLSAGPVLGVISGSTFRLLSDQASAAIQAAAEAAQAAAEEARDQALAGVPALKFSSVTALRSFSAATSALVASTLGYTAPFEAQNGGAIYAYDVSDTTTADDGILTIVDGASRRWKQRIAGALNALTAGLKTTGNMNTILLAAIAAAALLPGKALAIPAGTYTLTTHVDFSALDRIELQGEVTFDFSTATVATSFTTNGSFVYVGGSAVTALPLLNADIAKGDTTVPFVSAHSFTAGDVFCLYDTVDGSYQGGRAEYRKGEWLHVAEVTSSTSVKTRETICDSYAAATNTPGRHPGKKFRISGGKLNIIEATGSAFNSISGVKLARLLDGDYSAIRPTNSNYAAMILEMCVGVSGDGYKAIQPNVGDGGLQYGIVFSGTQDVDIQGDFYGYRHAVTTGGSTGIGFVVNRHIYVSGVARNAPDAAVGIAAVNTHGNTNDFRFVGLLDGGYSGGGNKIHCEGEFIGKASQTGVVILLVEMSGCDYKFRGKVFTAGDAATVTRGVIDMGGNAVNSLNASTYKGGTLDFDGLDINAPIGRIGIRLVNRGYVGTEKVKISIKGTRMRPSTGTTPVLLQTSIISGNNFDEMHCDGVQNDNDGWSITAGSIVSICGWRAAGTATVTPASTAVNNASQAITFARKAPRTPVIYATPVTNLIGGKRYTTAVISPTATGATLQALTADSANFGSTTAGNLAWLAVVQDL